MRFSSVVHLQNNSLVFSCTSGVREKNENHKGRCNQLSRQTSPQPPMDRYKGPVDMNSECDDFTGLKV